MSCPTTMHALPAYYLIMPSEASSNLASSPRSRYGLLVMLADGVENPNAKVMRATRDAGFGDEVGRIILAPTPLSSGYYDAYAARRRRCAALSSTAGPRVRAGRRAGLADPRRPRRSGSRRRLDDPVSMYLNDIATIPANLAGVGISLPAASATRTASRPASRSSRRSPTTGSTGSAPFETLPDHEVGRYRCSPRLPSEGGLGMSASTTRLMSFDEALEKFDPVMGLEVHVEASTASKMFGCPRVRRGAEHPRS